MLKAEATKIAHALQRAGQPASAYDSGSNYGYGVLNYDTNALYFNPWAMPTDWVGVYRKIPSVAAEIKKLQEADGS